MEENLSLEFILATIEQKILYLEEHPETKANGFYTRRLATKYGEIENLKVPRVRDGTFKPRIVPGRRKAFFDLAEVAILMFASGVNVKDVAEFIPA